MVCPKPTQDLELNTRNRDSAIKAEHIKYGPRMDECMPGETSDDDGRLGYCWMHNFKCHSARSCYTWAKGGPIEEDKVSYDWQKRGESE